MARSMACINVANSTAEHDAAQLTACCSLNPSHLAFQYNLPNAPSLLVQSVLSYDCFNLLYLLSFRYFVVSARVLCYSSL
jgi:hypothetical protein